MKKLLVLSLLTLFTCFLVKNKSLASHSNIIGTNPIWATEEATSFGDLVQTPVQPEPNRSQVVKFELQRTTNEGLKGFLNSPLFIGIAFLSLVFGLIFFLKKF